MSKITRRILAVLLATGMTLSLVACGSSKESQNNVAGENSTSDAIEDTAMENATGAESEDAATEVTFPKSVIKGTEEDADANDNTMGVVNEAFAAYYQEGTAAEGVAAIIAAGNCFINGIAVPESEEAFDEQCPDGFMVNETAWMVKGEEGWTIGSGYSAITLDGSYEEAATEMIKNMVSNGSETLLYDDDEDGYADRIEENEYLAVGVTELVSNEDGTYTIDVGTYIDTIDYPEKYATLLEQEFGNVDREIFHNISSECFDETIASGDCAMYYKAADGNWYFVRATEVSGTFNDGTDHQSYTMNNVVYPDAMNGPETTYSASNRSGGYSNFVKYFELNDKEEYPVSMWLVPASEYATATGKPLGFTSNESAVAFLETAIACAQEKLDSTAISEDGSDVEAGMQWISANLYNELADAVTMAQATLDAGETRSIFLDYQCYLIYMALHGTAGDITAQYTGYNFDGFDSNASYYYTLATIENEADLKLSDSQFDSYFTGGNAAEGLQEIVNAGEVYVNNFAITAEEADFEVNGQTVISQGDDGWNWSTHEKYSGTSETYADAAYQFVENLTGLEGQSVQLLAETGTQTVAQIKTTVVETALAYGTDGTYAGVWYTGEDGNIYQDGNGEDITFDSENGASSVTTQDDKSVYAGDIYIYWKDAETLGASSQWVAVRAAYVRGTISGTTEEPMWTEEGSSETVPIEEAIVGTLHLPEANTLEAYIEDGEVVTMWYLPTDAQLNSSVVSPGLTNKTIGFTNDTPETGENAGDGMEGGFGE